MRLRPGIIGLAFVLTVPWLCVAVAASHSDDERAKRPAPALSAPSGARAPAPVAPPSQDVFAHDDYHVSDKWKRGEVHRDCRGCHDYRDPAAVSDARVLNTNHCKTCHLDRTLVGPNKYDYGNRRISASDEQAFRDEIAFSAVAGFTHLDHYDLLCKTCHVKSPDRISIENMGSAMPVLRGIEWCIGCHQRRPTQDATARMQLDGQSVSVGSELLQRFTRKLNVDEKKAMAVSGPFRHSDHLADPLNPEPDACWSCHDSLRSADAKSYGERGKLFATASCGSCHIESDQPVGPISDKTAALVFPVASRQGAESQAKWTFSHADHLRNGENTVGEKGCLTCHEYIASPATGEPTYRVKEGYHGYKRCVQCHDEQKVVEQRAGASATFVSWSVKRHGEYDQCSKCHSPVDPAETDKIGKMRDNRPTATVARPRPVGYLIEFQQHPLIGGEPVESSANCAECHRARIPNLPSRIQKQKFLHSRHVDQKNPEASCITCHGNVEKAVTSAALDRIYVNEDRCLECHRGGSLKPDFGPAPKRREVNDFSHADHFGKSMSFDGKERKVRCIDCHKTQEPPRANDTEAYQDLGYLENVTNCIACHDHEPDPKDPAKLDRTSGYDTREAGNCFRCHLDQIPTKGQVMPIARSMLALSSASAGTQFHPTDRDCDECHRVQPKQSYAAKNRYVARLIDPTKKKFHRQGTPRLLTNARGINKFRKCFDCHWGVLKERSELWDLEPRARRDFGRVHTTFRED